MLISEVTFWISLVLLFYCYIGYGILVFLINRIRTVFQKKPQYSDNLLPPVTLIITAYNEAAILKEKLFNTTAIDYPEENFNVIVITDGSADDSLFYLKEFPAFTHLHQDARLGKLAAIKRAMQVVKSPIVVFSDANTMLNPDCIKKIVRHYNDVSVGGVAGEKKILSVKGSAVGEAEGLYWKYESFMKREDARLNTVVGAAGELFSIRTELFEPLADNVILDDFVISMNVCLKRKKIAYEPEAFASELPSLSMTEERKRKVRISAGAYQSIPLLRQTLNIFRHPLLTVQYISRRLLRWVVCPVMIIVLLVTNIFLFVQDVNEIYKWAFYIQITIYLAALFGWILISLNKKAGILAIPFYFLFMNFCLIQGFIRFVKNKQSVTWERSKRVQV